MWRVKTCEYVISINWYQRSKQTNIYKYLNPIIIDKNYQKILDIIIKNIDENDLTSFDVEDFEDKLTNEEKTVLKAFLYMALDDDVITRINHTNKYKFKNPLYTTYLKINQL